MEQFNPDYDRKLKQRTKEVWGPKFVKGALPALLPVSQLVLRVAVGLKVFVVFCTPCFR